MTTKNQPTILESLSALNDVARLRVLRILSQQELSVGEISDTLQLPQSTVSRHLKVLLETDFVARRTIGTTGLYRISDSMPNSASKLWGIAEGNFGEVPCSDEDGSRLVSVLAQRSRDSKSFFKNSSSEWESLRSTLFGRCFTPIALLSLLDPGLKVIDIGCGIGNAGSLLSPYVSSVVGVDRESAMLDEARQRPDLSSNITFVEGDASCIPEKENTYDVALFCLVLHHVEEIELAVKEASRVIKSGGRILIIDMQEHTHHEYKHTMGHVHLGFSEDSILLLAKSAGLRLQSYHRLHPDANANGPSLFAAVLH
jgi:SAM-dependent methyltransferase